MAQLAQPQNVTVTDADVDARLDRGGDDPGAAPRVDDRRRPRARQRRDGVHRRRGEGGRQGEGRPGARRPQGRQGLGRRSPSRVSTDPTKAQGGDLGFIDKDAALDPPFVDALVAAAPGHAHRRSIEGADGIYRDRARSPTSSRRRSTRRSRSRSRTRGSTSPTSGRRSGATSCAPSSATRSSPATSPRARSARSPRSGMQEGQSESGEGAIRVRHILYSPNDDPQAASTVAATDPAWAKAEQDAKATYDEAQGRSRRSSTRSPARRATRTSAVTTGGKLPYFSTEDAIDPAFAAAIYAPGLVPGPAAGARQVGVRLARDPGHALPDRPRVGEHAQDADRRRDADVRRRRPRQLRQGGRRRRAATWAGSRKGQLDPQVEAAIFAAPIGKVSDPLKIDGDGVYLFLVNQEQTRDAGRRRRRQTLETTAFSTWYSDAEGRLQDRSRPRDHRVRQHELTSARAAGRCSTRSSPRRGSAGASIPPRASPSSSRSASSRPRSSRTVPLLIVPAWRLQRRADRRRRPAALPGPPRARHRTASRVLRRLYPGRPPGRPLRACPTGRPSARSPRTSSKDTAVPRPGRARRRPRLAVGHALDLGPPPRARRLPVGPGADPRLAAQPPPRGGVRGLRRARGRARPRSWPASSATCCSRSCSTRSWRPRRACST